MAGPMEVRGRYDDGGFADARRGLLAGARTP